MTLLPRGVKVHLAFGFIDMRNYAEPTIMRSARPFDPRSAPLSTV
jgi:hypothetical protein